MSDVVRLGDPGELVSAVPHLLSFHPVQSLVVIALERLEGSARARVGVSLRVDLPAREFESAMCEAVVAALGRAGATAVTVVVVGGERDPDDDQDLPPRAQLVGEFDLQCVGAGIEMVHAVWAARTAGGSPWECYADRDCRGETPDPGSSVLGAATAVTGAVTYGSREELAELLQPQPQALSGLLRRRQMLTAQPAPGSGRPELYATVVAALEAAERSQLPTTDEEIVELARALTDTAVRDAALTAMLDERGQAAERLWLELVRQIPGVPHRAAPATMVAVGAYLRGDGAMARVALDVATRAYPSYALAELVAVMLDNACPPQMVRDALTEATADALALCKGE